MQFASLLNTITASVEHFSIIDENDDDNAIEEECPAPIAKNTSNRKLDFMQILLLNNIFQFYHQQ